MRSLIKFIAAFAILAMFAACSEKAVKPPPENFDPAKAFEEANAQFDKKLWADARQSYLAIKLRDNTGKYASLAQLRVADTYYEEGEPDDAIEQYRRFLETYPSDRYAYYAQYQIAMIYYSQIKGPDRAYSLAERALGEFKKLNETYPRNPYRELVETKIEHCRDLLAEHEFMVAVYDFDRQGYQGAIDRFLNVIEYYPNNNNIPAALYYVVAGYKRLGQKDKAQEYYETLKTKYPDKPYTNKAKEELASPDPAPAAPVKDAKPGKP